MAHLHIEVDGDTVMDGDTGEWVSDPPQLVTEAIKATRPAVWMQALMLVVAHAAMAEADLGLVVNTRANGWEMAVTDGHHPA